MAAEIGRTARGARRAAGLSLRDIAERAGVARSTVLNFEQGNRWVRQTDGLVDAYESLCGIAPQELWVRAVAVRLLHHAERGAVCERCGFVAEHGVQVDVLARDGDPISVAPENVRLLCANCHRVELVRVDELADAERDSVDGG